MAINDDKSSPPARRSGQRAVADGSDDRVGGGERIARRTLLRASLYVPPAIIGTLLVSRDAQAQTPSCGPQSCNPIGCQPPGPCGPDRKGGAACTPAGCNPGAALSCGPSGPTGPSPFVPSGPSGCTPGGGTLQPKGPKRR